MIKKLVLMVLLTLGVGTSLYARDSYSRDASALPETARTTISDNFKAKVNIVKTDKELGRVNSYDVILTDGSEISFDRQGNWNEIEVGRYSRIPQAFIPDNVSKYVKSKHPGQKIVGIEKTRSGYEVELANNVEIIFDKQGTFMKYE